MKGSDLLIAVLLVGFGSTLTGCGSSNEPVVNQPKEVKTQEQIMQEIAAEDAARLERARERMRRRDD